MSEKKPVKYQSRKAEIYRSPTCLNCGAELRLTDKYCPQCSQLNTTKQLSLKDFFGEFFSSIFVYDSRLRYTLKDLLFKPGVITRNYVNGQRLKYANPFRFFLSISIVYFLLQGLILSFTSNNNNIHFNSENNSFNYSLNDYDKLKEELKKEIEKDKSNPVNADSILSFLDSLKVVNSQVDSLKKEKKKLVFVTQKELDTVGNLKSIALKFKTYRDFYQQTKIKNPILALDSLNHKKTNVNIWLYNKNDAIERFKNNPLGFVTYIMNKIPFFLFFFAPVFALFFWLLYSKKKHTYMEHLVFIFHIFSFIFLALLISLLVETIIKTDILTGLIFSLIGPFYFYKALRNFYKEDRIITLIKFLFLNLIFVFGASFAAAFFILTTAAFF